MKLCIPLSKEPFLQELIFLKKPTVEDILNQGIYGPLETKPDERRKFLGTLRERIVIALLKKQVAEKKVFPQVEQYMKNYPGAHLLLNGKLNYSHLSKYVKLAAKYKLGSTIVTNKEYDTEIGLVLTMDHAIDKEEIYIRQRGIASVQQKQSLFSRLFKRKG